MFFLRNGFKIINPMLNNVRKFSNCNNNCNFDIQTKQKIQLLFAMSPSLYVLSICNFALTIASIFAK